MKILLASLLTFCSIISMAHTVFEPNDIPLLDNRFRIDPETEQVTFILNHSQGRQRIVLVQPDGSKLYEQRHPDTVSWVSGTKQDMITVQNPMAGPWQAIAKLDGENRIKIISDVELIVNRLPLKLYAKEYITTTATLFADKKLIENPSYLEDAKLSVSLIGTNTKKMSLYLDDGKHYDELSFDGKLTARLFVDLPPGRYLLSIRTKNDIFIRSVNKDAVVFLTPITYKISSSGEQRDHAKISFKSDAGEIDPNSISINGVIKDASDNIVQQVLMHSIDNISESGEFESTYSLEYGLYHFSGLAYATTLDGREIELQLDNHTFELVTPFVLPEITTSDSAMPLEEGAISTAPLLLFSVIYG
ncbi:hypothetical protein ACLKMH_00225 [Psychromonas sp. KJ10-10]|uniref:hypothetical protein n=1 Tax=Psychromonas sp. KJ10-10 TaxID=3391823 RepID=UPI0039B588C9